MLKKIKTEEESNSFKNYILISHVNTKRKIAAFGRNFTVNRV